MNETEIHKLHDEAMNLTEEGFFLQRQKKEDEAKAKYKSAFDLEKQCADFFINLKEPVEEIEPTRSIFCRSAACLAFDSGLMTDAKYYAGKVVEFNFDSSFIEEVEHILNP